MQETEISRAIIDSYVSEWRAHLDVDVCVAGAGPAGMLTAKRTAEAGLKTLLIEKRMSLGGGIWGGGMMFNKIVVQDPVLPILDELDIRHTEHAPGYQVTDAVEFAAGLIMGACRAGVKVFNLMTVEDVMVRDQRVCGCVVNWTAVDMAGLHIDPMTFQCRALVDATGHPAEVTKLAIEKSRLPMDKGVADTIRERSMWAERAEDQVVEMTGPLCPGLYVVGMAASAARGGHRMGPIFGGMLLSAEKLAKMLVADLAA